MRLPRSVVVPMGHDVAAALLALSRREYRSPRDQARLLVVDGLCRAGLLPGTSTQSPEASETPAVNEVTP